MPRNTNITILRSFLPRTIPGRLGPYKTPSGAARTTKYRTPGRPRATKQRTPGRLGQQTTEKIRGGSDNKLPNPDSQGGKLPRDGITHTHRYRRTHTMQPTRTVPYPRGWQALTLGNADCGSTGSDQLRPTSTIHRSPWPCGRKRKASACETRRAISHLGIGGGRSTRPPGPVGGRPRQYTVGSHPSRQSQEGGPRFASAANRRRSRGESNPHRGRLHLAPT